MSISWEILSDNNCAASIIQQGNLYGIIDSNDSMYVAPQYQSLEYISTKSNDSLPPVYFFLAEKENKKGIISQKNEIISTFELEGESDFPFSDEVFVISKNGKQVLFNGEGKIIINGNYDKIGPFDGSDNDGKELVLVSKGKKLGLLKLDGTVLLECMYDKINANTDYYDLQQRAYFTFEKDNKLGLICNTGEIIFQPIAETARLFA